jgi:hypothetical protein
MNANPTSGPISKAQLLTWARFADLRGAKSFRCVRLVEAGGVEPPSEKRYGPKPTCLAHSVWFAGRAQNEQETRPTSPMVLTGTSRAETHRPAC